MAVENRKVLHPSLMAAETSSRLLFKLESRGSIIRAFRWTGKNQYFALCEAGFISFGGG